MNKSLLFISLLTIFSFLSCKNEEQLKPKVIYDDTSKIKGEVVKDTTLIEIADLPVLMEGTNYLIFPIGTVVSDRKSIKSSYEAGTSYTVSNYGEYQITGFLKNLKFQEIGKDSIYALSEKPIFIQTATYLKSVADKDKVQFLLYTLSDVDTNKDKKLDANDIKSLYLSTISGKNFIKISPDFQELIDWKLIDSKSRLYFRTTEDSNKNGEFDKEDKLHYYFLNLLDKERKVQEYKPV
jgi:hypothetical protein